MVQSFPLQPPTPTPESDTEDTSSVEDTTQPTYVPYTPEVIQPTPVPTPEDSTDSVEGDS